MECSDCEKVNLDNENLVFERSDENKEDFGEEMEEKGGDTYSPPSLDTPPEFQPLVSPFSPHVAQHRVPPTINNKSPLAFFMLFASDTEFEIFSANTNAYARPKGPKPRNSKRRQLPWEPKYARPWLETTAKEIMVWFGLLIFIGLVETGAKGSRVDTY